MKRCKINSSGAARGRLFSFVALALAFMVVSQVLPVRLAGNDPGPGQGEASSVLTLEPVQVCNSGADFSGFLADHPWVAAAGIAPLLSGIGIAHVPPPEPGLPEGALSTVYRPPRIVLS